MTLRALRTNRGWVIDELASAGRENLDAVHVSRYDAKEDAAAASEVELLASLGMTPDSVVVDIGAGTGQFTIAVAPACARVIGVDVSPLMLDRLRDKVHDAAVANVETVQAGFLSYEHQGSAADVVYSRYALHHLPDFWKALALHRVHSMLRPGGLFRLWDIVYSGEPRDAPALLDAWCSTRAVAPDDGGWNRGDIEEHIRDEHSTFTWLLEPMIERTGFTIEQAEYSDDGIFAKYVLRRQQGIS